MAVATVKLTKTWVENWPDPTVRTELTRALMALPMDTSSARAWMSSIFAFGARPSELLEVADEWSRAGLPTEEVLAWAESGCWLPADALRWHLRDFTAQEADFIANVVPYNVGCAKLYEGCEREALAWRDSGLSPRLTVLGVASDLTPASMLAKVASGEMGVSRQGDLALHAGVLRGLDVQRLEINWRIMTEARRTAALKPRRR